MEYDFQVIQKLYEIWKSANYDLKFYTEKILAASLSALERRTEASGVALREGGISQYKALFIPVGFSIENVLLIAAALRPAFLRLAFTESSMRFHRKHLEMVEETIKNYCKQVVVSFANITCDDQKYMEQKIIEWVEEMRTGYGLACNQLAIDLTGGTKPMSIGAYNAAMSFDEIDGLYLRTDYDTDSQAPLPGTESLIRLKKGKAQEDKDLIFVIMPFSPGYDVIYQWIELAISECGMRCLRADKEIFAGGIMDRVKENIKRAGVIIADLTGRNVNVFYELGLAHSNSKNVVMITQNAGDLPFDVRHLRTVVYDNSDKVKFQEDLKAEITFLK